MHVGLLVFRSTLDEHVPRTFGDQHMDGTCTLSGRASSSLNRTYRTRHRFVQHHQIGRWHVQPLFTDGGCDEHVDLTGAKSAKLLQLLPLRHAFLLTSRGLANERIGPDGVDAVQDFHEVLNRVPVLGEHQNFSLWPLV